MGVRAACLAAAAAVCAAVSLGPALGADVKPPPTPPPAPVRVEQPPTWASLTRAQQQALAPLQRDWAVIDTPRKQKWIEVVTRFPNLGDAERQRVQERMGEWARMTPAERGNARLQFQEMRQISAEDRQARWEAYKALPDDERKALAQRAKPVVKPASAVAQSRPEPRPDTAPKRNILPLPVSSQQPPLKTVAPTVVQARPGATTTLLTTRQDAPVHQQPGLPKIAATSGFVNPNTLLPKLGPQGAAVTAAVRPAATPPPQDSP